MSDFDPDAKSADIYEAWGGLAKGRRDRQLWRGEGSELEGREELIRQAKIGDWPWYQLTKNVEPIWDLERPFWRP